jgi:ribonuclease HI
LGYWSREGQKKVVDTRRKIIELRTTTTITFYWIKGHTGLKGKERADYLTKTVVSYNPNITYEAIPVFRGKQLLEVY